MNLRWSFWISINCALICACLAYALITTDFYVAGVSRALLSASIAVLGLLSAFTFPALDGRKKVILIGILCLLTRVSLLPTAPSDDIYRYLWEGKLNSQNISPFQAPADNPKYIEQRDPFWEKMNHKDKPTAYPPIAMYIFSWINSLDYSPMSYKITFLILDLLLIATLLALLHHYHRPLHWVLFYALSPISLLSFSAEGHFDILMVLAFIFSLLALSKRWIITCGVAIGIAVGVKIMALVVAPLILWKAGWKGILAAILTISIPVTLHWEDILQMFHGLFSFGSNTRFNGPLHQLISALSDNNYTLASQVTTLTFFLIWSFGFYLMLKNRLWEGLVTCFGSLLLFSPVVHFWYLGWILPLIALRPKLSWISLSLTMSLYFLVWDQQAQGGAWEMPVWARWCFWLPFFILLIAEQRSLFSRLKHISHPPSDITFSIIIPTYNPGKNLQNAIDCLHQQIHPPEEIILVDADSHDSSIHSLNHHKLHIQTISSELGRGQQIKAGVEQATQSIVLILHADNYLKPDSLSLIKQALEKNPQVVGGSLGQRFNARGAGLLLIEAMNEFRATLLHTSFGDQTQFFYREICLKQEVLTDQPLMEDVEMSDRINQLGDTLHLAHESSVSAKKWTSGIFYKRFFTIIEFCLRYRLLYWSRKKRANLSKQFYQRYYKK